VPNEPIAIVGLSAIFPGSEDEAGFWRDIVAGKDLITDVPARRWLIEDHYDPDPRAEDKTYCKRGAFLSPCAFDPLEFGVPPQSIPATDSCQLLSLIAARRVLDDVAKGQRGEIDRERASVILGVTSGQQLFLEVSSRMSRPIWVKALRESGIAEAQVAEIANRIAASYVPWQENTFPGMLGNVVAGRIANRFDLRGTNCVTDAACASSLAALSMAMDELRLHRSDLVITGGADTFNDISMFVAFSKTPALSPTGDCRPFSDRADGTVLGEGVAMFALKRLSDAERDGNAIYAVIRAIGSSSDGRSKSIYAPLSSGQARALRRAYEEAGFGPEAIELVEAHGTGTAAGDAAEIESLRMVFDPAANGSRQWCALGSVKSQVGHTKAAAGAAALFKTAMALHHRTLPPTIKVDRPNPALRLNESPFYVNTTARPWIPRNGGPRRAALSSFGFGGTNFHAIVEEYTGPSAQPKRVWPNSAELVLLSAADAGTLRDACLKTAKLCEAEAAPLANIAFASQCAFDAALAHRAGAVASDYQEMSRKLRQIADGKFPPGTFTGTGAEAGKIAFLFPGQGSQYVGMGADLAMTFPEAMAVWGQAPEAAAVAFPPHAFSREEEEAQARKLTATENAQPSVGAASAATLALVDRLGVRADCVGGHSFGEITALFAAGAISLETMLAIARRRGELMRDAATEPAGMLSVRSEWSRIREILNGLAVAAANHNGPAQVVLSGASAPLAEAEQRLRAAGFTVTALPVSTAFHSPLMQPAARAFGDYLEQTEIAPPRLSCYSNRDGAPHSARVARDVAAQIAAPVFFAQMIERMYADGVRTFLEVGPRDVLTSLVGSILEGKPHRAIATDRAGGGLRALWEGLAALAVAGVPMNWRNLREHHAVSDAISSAAEGKFSVPIDGGNYGRPYPPPGGFAALPKPVAAARAVPVAPAASGGEISGDAYRVFQESITAAHRDWQANLAKGHEAFLRSMEAALGGTGAAPLPQPPRVEAPRVELPPAPVEIVPSKADAPPPSRALIWEIVAEKTGYPADMLEPSMALEADLGIDSIKRVEIFSALQERFPEFAGADTAMLGSLRTLDDVLQAMNGAAAAPSIEHHVASSQPAVWEIVAEKTGYPADMLESAMALEADLGIDSIKRVEIFSALQERFPAFANTDTAALGSIRTLGEIVAALDGTSPASTEASAPALDETGRFVWETVAEKTGYPVEMLESAMVLEDDLGIDGIKRLEIFAALENSFAGLDSSSFAALRTLGDLVAACKIAPPAGPGRFIVSARPAAPCGESILESASRIVIADDGRGVADALAGMLEKRGFSAMVADDFPGADAWIFLAGVGAESGARKLHWDAIRFAKAASRAKVLVTVQDSGHPWLGGLSGLAKTAALEWPSVRVKAIRIETAGRAPDAIAEALLEELLRGGHDQEVELTKSSRNVLETIETGWNLLGNPPSIPANPVIVATGGARGVTAACLQELARAIRPKLVLFGRTALETESAATSSCEDAPSISNSLLAKFRAEGKSISPIELKEQAVRILAVREVRRTVDLLEHAGAQVRYFAIDGRNVEAVRGALMDVRREWGPIYGVIHAAGVLADKEISGMSAEQFDAVFSTKVDALRVLLEATAEDPIGLLCVFSSAAARYGNRGQAAYAIANEILNRVAEAEAQRRGSSCIVRAIDWGPWDGGMVTPELAKHFAQRNVPLIGMQEGARLFVKELLSGEAAVEVVIGNFAPPQELRVAVGHATHPHLRDHVIRDVPVLPVVEAVGMVLRAAAAQGRHPQFPCFTDVRVLRGVRLDGFHNGGNLLTVRSRGETMFELSSADGTRHYEADLRPRAGAPDTPQQPAPQLGPLSAAPWIDHEIYGKLLFHGPEFRLIREIEGVSDRGIAGTLRPRAGEQWRRAVDGYDPGMLDGGLQLARLWGFFKLGRPTLPMRIGRLEILADADGAPIQCQVSATAGANRIVCDISFYSMKKDLLAFMTGVEMYASPEA
jgi:acyl transferase domain-containing protein/acyl carrier protein/NADP-dependent 3-hydroxy acid dehydrogenase YdfG